MLLMVYPVFTGGVNGTGPLWIYIIPPVALFLGDAQTKLPGKMGSEEYLFLLPETSGIPSMQLAEKLRTKVEKEQYTQDDKNFSVTISIGLHQIAVTDRIN